MDSSTYKRLFYEFEDLGLEIRTNGIESYLRDESKLVGDAFGVVRAFDSKQVAQVLRICSYSCAPVTVSAGRTSITGSSVPYSGIVLDISQIKGFDQQNPSCVRPGTILADYRKGVDELGLFYPPDPTSQDSCAIGGNVACNASGALSYLYGPTREYIQGLEIAFTNGSLLSFKRGDFISNRGFFTVPKDRFDPPLQDDAIWPAPKLDIKPWRTCKNAAGLFSEDKMDLVDLFIGSEGILGVVTNIVTRLMPKRKPYFALMLYTHGRRQTVELVKTLDLFRKAYSENDQHALEKIRKFWNRNDPPFLTPACMEWFSSSCAALLSEPRASRLAESYGSIFIEQEYEPDQDPWDVAEVWSDFMETFNDQNGQDPQEVYVEVALDAKGIREIRNDRLMVPERLNQLIRPGMVKIGADFATPMDKLEETLELYDQNLPKGVSYTFGHIGNAHVHYNITPRSEKEKLEVKDLNLRLAQKICQFGGTISAEHGAGKIKHQAVEIMFGPEGISEMLRVKKAFDPALVLNRHNIFPLERFQDEPLII